MGLGWMRGAESPQILSPPCLPHGLERADHLGGRKGGCRHGDVASSERSLQKNLEDEMSRQVEVAMVDYKLAEIDAFLPTQFGMLVLNDEEMCIWSSTRKTGHGLQQGCRKASYSSHW